MKYSEIREPLPEGTMETIVTLWNSPPPIPVYFDVERIQLEGNAFNRHHVRDKEIIEACHGK
jgi:hypothetical protein